MLERFRKPQKPKTIEQLRRSRRNFAYVLIAASFLGTEVGIKVLLEGGGRMFPPNTTPIQKEYAEVINPRDGNVRINNSSGFLNPDSMYEYTHRAGNTIADIDLAFNEGTDLFDIDANDFSGTVYGEHGFILHENIFGKEFNLVFDPNEGELTTKMSAKFEDLIKHICLLSTPDRQLGVKIELKYGPFNTNTVEQMIDILFANNVPAIMQPITKERHAFILDYTTEKEISILPKGDL
ncbi:MAG: hypothetical protein V1697_00450 [Candidatus Levyibacteriota bacterium]